MTLREWRDLHKLSKSTAAKLKNMGLFPRELVLPNTNVIRISHEADREWVNRMRALAEQDAAKLERARRVELARQAAQSAIRSPKHVSRIKRPGRRRT
jgi:hypothetical protein